MSDEVRQIELRRLRELERRAAAEGPHTPPEIIIEIQDLRAKHGVFNGKAKEAGYRSSLDYEFLMNTVAGALLRLTALEEYLKVDRQARERRNTVLSLWFALLTILLVVIILMVLVQ